MSIYSRGSASWQLGLFLINKISDKFETIYEQLAAVAKDAQMQKRRQTNFILFIIFIITVERRVDVRVRERCR